MKKLAIVSMLLMAALGMGGCATPFGDKLNAAAAERIDLGDGLVFDIVPVSVGGDVADKVVPGSGKVIDLVEKKLAAKRMAKLGPFNGLPYTTTRSVILKNGTVITQEEIAKIVETLTPIVPGAVTRVIEPADFGTAPANPGPQPPAATAGTNSVDELSIDDFLQDIGGTK